MGFAEFGLSSYVCPICGHYSITNDRFPVCDFCKNDNLIILHGEELDKVNNTIEEMSDEELKQYLYLEKADEYRYQRFQKNPEKKRWNDEGIAFHEYLRQKYVFNNPLFDKEKYNQRVDWSLESSRCSNSRKRPPRSGRSFPPSLSQVWLYRVPDGPPQVVAPYRVLDEQGGPGMCKV